MNNENANGDDNGDDNGNIGECQNCHSCRTNNHDGHFPLFIVNPSVILEIRDCQISSLVSKSFSNTEGDKLLNDIQDIAIVMNTSRREELKPPSLILKSTIINGFFTFIYSHDDTSITIQKCLFLDSRSYGINVVSPRTLNINDSKIEKTGKSAINIRIATESVDKHQKNYDINNNEIKETNSYGISIYAETMKYRNISLKIYFNIISNCKKDAIALKFLILPTMEIRENELNNNNGNGLFLQCIVDTISKSQILIILNNISNNEKNGILLKDVDAILQDNKIKQNGLNGIDLAYTDQMMYDDLTFFSKNVIRVILNNNIINGHTEAGIAISGCVKGPILFNTCIIRENLNGIFVKEHDWPTVNISSRPLISSYSPNLSHSNTSNNENLSSNKNLILAVSPSRQLENQSAIINIDADFQNSYLGKTFPISFEKCDISHNSYAGLIINKICGKLFLSKTKIIKNNDFAILLESKEHKDLIHFKDLERGKIKHYIQGYIGTWDEIYKPSKNSRFKSNNCSIF